MNKYEWWHEYLVDVVAWCAIWNLVKTTCYLRVCEAYMVPISIVSLALSVQIMAYIYFLAMEMEMME